MNKNSGTTAEWGVGVPEATARLSRPDHLVRGSLPSAYLQLTQQRVNMGVSIPLPRSLPQSNLTPSFSSLHSLTLSRGFVETPQNKSIYKQCSSVEINFWPTFTGIDQLFTPRTPSLLSEPWGKLLSPCVVDVGEEKGRANCQY